MSYDFRMGGVGHAVVRGRERESRRVISSKEARIRGEAAGRGLNPNFAVEISNWGQLEIGEKGDFSFAFDIRTTDYQNRVVSFIKEGEVVQINIHDIDHILGAKSLVHATRIPVTRVETESLYGDEQLKVLWAVCDLGVVGEFKFGVTNNGEFRFENRLKQEQGRF